VLDVAVAEVSLQRPGIVALVGQRKATGVAQHVRMSRKAQLGLDTSALHHARKACRRERRPPLAGEHERRLGILLPLQLAQGPHFIADNGMGGRRALLGPADVAPATPGSQTEPGLIIYRFGADLFYANADRFADEVRSLVDKAPASVRWFVLDAGTVTDLDYSAARTVRDLLGELSAKNVAVMFARVNTYLRADLDRHGISAKLGEARIFATLHEAIDATRPGGPLAGPDASKTPVAS